MGFIVRTHGTVGTKTVLSVKQFGGRIMEGSRGPAAGQNGASMYSVIEKKMDCSIMGAEYLLNYLEKNI